MNSLLDPYFYAYNPELLAFENAWINYMKNGIVNDTIIKPEVATSWFRCRELGIDPIQNENTNLLLPSEIEKRIKNNSSVLRIAMPYIESLYEIVIGSGFVIHYIDNEGYILKSIGDLDTLEICKKTNSIPGANRIESCSGTSSIALAFILKKAIQIAGAEHYIQIMHRWTCSSAPVVNETGEVICVLCVSGRYEMIHQHTLGMISSAAKAVENEIYIQKIKERLLENNNQLQATVEMLNDGIVYISGGLIVQLNQSLCTLIGVSSINSIGEKASKVLLTTPSLDEFINKTKAITNFKIFLHGKDRKYRCFLDVNPVFGELSQVIGQIIIFKRVDEIKALANTVIDQAKYTFNDIIGNSENLQIAIDMALKASAHNVRVIIEGESGTGKEMFAQAIHNQSSRSEAPFIPIDCGAIPKELLESELFGYEKGAFTGAKNEGKIGVFEAANGGTVFLDEVGNMPLEMQQKLLRALQEKVITRISSTKQIPIDIRIIAATNGNLDDQIEKGKFRQDLYYRLSVIRLKIPPLRERKEDIPLLAQHLLSTDTIPSKVKYLDKSALSLLEEYDWPGNIRQLMNVIEYALIMCKGDIIKQNDFPIELLKNKTSEANIQFHKKSLKHEMSEYVKQIVDSNDGNISKASKQLKISRSTIYKLIGESNSE